ncbi:hypothetical protein HZ326_0635 [Fusarium oxysporum f. sp. albedinis]|nr:hypothetical protein HZ326_0635 [Fusarium oxysporum f. sp. albedinis]
MTLTQLLSLCNPRHHISSHLHQLHCRLWSHAYVLHVHKATETTVNIDPDADADAYAFVERDHLEGEKKAEAGESTPAQLQLQAQASACNPVSFLLSHHRFEAPSCTYSHTPPHILPSPLIH